MEMEQRENGRSASQWLLTHVIALCLGGALAFGVLGLLNRTRPVPLVIEPPRPTATWAPTPTPEPVAVYVHGAVAAPGVYSLPHAARVEDALAAAGGLTAEGSLDGLNLAQPVAEGLEIEVRAAVAADSPSREAAAGAAPAVPAASGQINLNSASAAELEQLPGIGPSTAENIVAFREEHGRFETIEAIMEVPGIGPAKFSAIQDYISVEP